MLYSNLISLLVSILLLNDGASASESRLSPRKPQPRSYDTHTYYSLELPPSSSLQDAASHAASLGFELVEPIGELAGHFLIRHHSSQQTHISSLERRNLHPSIRSIQPLKIRQRSKRLPPHSSSVRMIRDHSLLYPGKPIVERLDFPAPNTDDTELLYAQNELDLKDPMLDQQWHLINRQMKDFELNVTGVWSRGITGEGVTVAIIDDGLDMNSDDLKDNFFAEGSYDFNDHTELPEPRLSDDQHGTRCAGEIAAVPNDVCGVGVSYGARVSGVRILSAPISDADEASALNYAYQLNDIYSCSWGPPDDGKSMEAPEGLILKAMVNGVQKGRGGKGSVFVFAAGNGGGSDDQCNFDGYTNSIFSITVGAIDRRGLHPYYSEMCSAMMMVAPSSGSGDHIHTTDVGKNNCAHTHGGTSAAAPLGVGVFALALQTRPDLTWRDLQHISVQSSVHLNPEDPDWQETATGRKYSYKYGYGMVDAYKFVEAAEKFKSVKPQAWFDSPAVYLPTTNKTSSSSSSSLSSAIDFRQDITDPEPGSADQEFPAPDGGSSRPANNDDGTFITEEGITSSFTVSRDHMKHSNLERLEHITVRVWITHQRRGDVEVELVSPNGIKSVLARQRRYDEDATGFWGWKFMSLKHWEEDPVGEWTITVTDRVNPDKTGRFVAWSLQLWGECIDPKLAKDWIPAEDGQPDEEQIGSEESTSTQVSQKPKPTEHLPGDHGEAEGESHEPGLNNPNPQPGAGTSSGSQEGEGGIAEGDTAGYEEGFFGGVANLAKENTSWLAGAGGIILLGTAGLGGFLVYRQRQKRKNLFGFSNDGQGAASSAAARGVYAPVANEDVPMSLLERGRKKFGLNGKGGNGGGGGGTKDLYDAFGDGPSDSDDDSVDVRDERVGLRYHDGFLDDEDNNNTPQLGKNTNRKEYRDDEDDQDHDHDSSDEKRAGGAAVGGGGVEREKEELTEGTSGSSGSWQDAQEDLKR